MTAVMNVQTRQQALAAMADERGLDILVIGGGITGVGIALDAATRGLRVGIVEADDWSSGTSSRSSKLVHGGLRYLQMLDFSLVHEALVERDLLLTEIAPHLVKPVSFLFPLEHRCWQRAYIGAGIMLYDTLASMTHRQRAMPWHRHVFRRGMHRMFKDMRIDAAIGAIRYWDAAVDDSRLVLNVLRTAISYGALAAANTSVVDLTKDATGRVIGASLRDEETGDVRAVRAKHVISATGVWTEGTEHMSGSDGGLRVLASKGVHIVVPRERLEGDSGVITQTEKSVLFIIPWSRYWIIGTTDTPWHGELRRPVATSADVDYVLEHANAVLRTPLTRDDIIGVFAGLRPLLQPGVQGKGTSAKVSREHTAATPTPGFTVIAGGKLTTYRVMAADAVDVALREVPAAPDSVTHRIPLLGAVGLEAIRNRQNHYMRTYGWSQMMMDHLFHRYGSMVEELVALIEAQPDLARPLAGAPSYTRAEIAYAAHNEGVLHLSDLMLTRTRLTYEQRDGGQGAVPEILDIVAPILGWDAERCDAEATEYARIHNDLWEATTLADDAAVAERWG